MSDNNSLQGIFANVNDDQLLRECGNLYGEVKELKSHQQAFIKYLEHYISLLKDKPDALEELQIDILEEVLEKYKEIFLLKIEEQS